MVATCIPNHMNSRAAAGRFISTIIAYPAGQTGTSEPCHHDNREENEEPHKCTIMERQCNRTAHSAVPRQLLTRYLSEGPLKVKKKTRYLSSSWSGARRFWGRSPASLRFVAPCGSYPPVRQDSGPSIRPMPLVRPPVPLVPIFPQCCWYVHR